MRSERWNHTEKCDERETQSPGPGGVPLGLCYPTRKAERYQWHNKIRVKSVLASKKSDGCTGQVPAQGRGTGHNQRNHSSLESTPRCPYINTGHALPPPERDALPPPIPALLAHLEFSRFAVDDQVPAFIRSSNPTPWFKKKLALLSHLITVISTSIAMAPKKAAAETKSESAPAAAAPATKETKDTKDTSAPSKKTKKTPNHPTYLVCDSWIFRAVSMCSH